MVMGQNAMLDNRVVVITGGAGGGIGQGVVRTIARHGAAVAIVDKDIDSASRFADDLRADAHTIEVYTCDVADARQVQRAVDGVMQRFGRIDGLVNSAGVGLIKPLHECTDDDYQRLLSIDLYGCFAMCRQVLPIMVRQGGGSIVNITSIHAERALGSYSLYSAAKAGLAGMTRGIAVEYGEHGIRANAIAPGLVDGPQTRSLLAQYTDDVDAWIHEFATMRQAAPRIIASQDVGEMVAFLLSERAAAITGTSVPVDCGLLAMISSREDT